MHVTEGAAGAAPGGGTGRPATARWWVGPYTLITALDDPRTRIPVPERRYIARSADGRHTVLLSLPHPGADPRRFLAEAEGSRYLLGPCAAPATALATPGGTAPARPPGTPAPTCPPSRCRPPSRYTAARCRSGRYARSAWPWPRPWRSCTGRA